MLSSAKIQRLQDRLIGPYSIAFGFVAIWLIFHGSRALFDFPFTFDETFTFSVAQSGDPASILGKLRARMDNHAPFHYLLAYAGIRLGGATEAGLRFPFLVFFAFNVILLARLAFDWKGPIASIWSAAALCSSNFIVFFSMEARMYTLLCTAALLIIWSWSRAASSQSYLAWGFLGIAAGWAILTHYYGVLLLIPVALAYVTLCWRARRVIREAGWALAPIVVALFSVLPFAMGARDYAAAFWTSVPNTPMGPLWNLLLYCEPLYYIWGSWILLYAVGSIFSKEALPPQAGMEIIQESTTVLIVSLLLAPFYHWLLAVTITKAYTSKYFLYVIVPIALLLGFIASEVGAFRRIPVTLHLVLAIAITGLAYYNNRSTYPSKRPYLEAIDRWKQLATKHPGYYTTGDYHLFLRYWMYAPAAMRPRLLLVSDPDRAVRMTGANTDELALNRLSEHVGMKRVNYQELLDQKQPIYFLNGSGANPLDWKPKWLEKSLIDEGRAWSDCSICALDGPIRFQLRPTPVN